MEGHAVAESRRAIAPAGWCINPLKLLRIVPLLAVALLTCGVGAQPHMAEDDAIRQYEPTRLIPRPDTRFIYVSSSQGNDNNDGRSANRPVRTVQRGVSLARNYSADWVLLKRGDVFFESINWNKNGRSADEPVVLTTWGDGPRPIIHPIGTTHDDHYGFMISAAERVHVSIVGIHFLAPAMGTWADGIRMVNDEGHDILIEDCVIQGFRNGVNMRDGKRVTIRGCIIIDNAPPNMDGSGRGQGIYGDGVEDLLLEFNIIDHNGWRPGGQRSMHNHNVYLRGSTANPLVRPVIRNNLSSRASSWGITASSDEAAGVIQPVVEHNVIYRCANGFVHGAKSRWAILESRVRYNLIANSGGEVNGDKQAFGMTIKGTLNSEVSHNILMDVSINGGYTRPLEIPGPGNAKGNVDLKLSGNGVFRWPQRHDGPILSVPDYEVVHQIDNLIAEARLDGASRPELTAPAINSWLRATRP